MILGLSPIAMLSCLIYTYLPKVLRLVGTQAISTDRLGYESSRTY